MSLLASAFAFTVIGPFRLVAPVVSRLDLLQDAIEVVGLRRLERWELLEAHKLLVPKLLAEAACSSRG
jgi:hypothetical protein